MNEGKKLEYSDKIPDDKLQKMSHAKAWKFKPHLWLPFLWSDVIDIFVINEDNVI